MGCAASWNGAAARKAASALPAMQRPKLEDVTGDAPMRRLVADFAQTANVAPRMAFLRRSRKNVSQVRTKITLNSPMWRYRDGGIRHKSHICVIRPTATLGRNPGDVLVRVLDVAGFTVDAVLRVDDEFRRARLLYPFIYAGRTITRRGASKYIVFGLFL